MSTTKPSAANYPPEKTPVAKDLFTLCTKEKVDTWHVVRNHNAQGIVDKVICKSCGSEHKYRAPKAAAPARASSRSVILRSASGALLARPTVAPTVAQTRADAGKSTLEETWFKGLKKWGTKEVSDFSPDTSYQAGEVFEHSVFGKGVVQARRENKIDVLFQIGLKTLPSRQG